MSDTVLHDLLATITVDGTDVHVRIPRPSGGAPYWLNNPPLSRQQRIQVLGHALKIQDAMWPRNQVIGEKVQVAETEFTVRSKLDGMSP